MKKILLVMSIAIIMALCSAPSFAKAAITQCGYGIITINGTQTAVNLFADGNVTYVTVSSYGWVNVNYGGLWYGFDSFETQCSLESCVTCYIPSLSNTTTLTRGSHSCTFYNDNDEYIESLPDEFRPPEPSESELKWRDFYEWYKDKYGFYPREGSLIDIIRMIAIGDWTDTEEVEITFPTLTPTPTPTPSPTPIPVQTIFVPDGNGNTTIIYQYPDPTTGVITQSPYNPNIENNITVNCDCNGSGGSDNNIFGTDPQDPYTLTSSMLWADGFGVQITDNPLTAANDSQKSLVEAASEYSDSVNVVSNSFNILPFKWLTLVGLLGGILIIAGLIRTFLGG